MVVADSNRRMPLDPAPADDGNIILLEGDVVRVLGAERLAARRAQPGGPGLLYRSHFVSCPDAASHRRR